MEKERAKILKEMKVGGGFNSGFFWRRAKCKKAKGMTKLRDDSGEIVTEEGDVAGLAASYFETLGRGSGWIVKIVRR